MESKVAEEILNYLCNVLGGEWLISGGALVRLKFDASRGTEDIDLMRVSHESLSDEAAKTQLFKWLIQKGSGPEYVNSAMEPFVREVADWKNQLVLLKSGSKGSLYRPNLTLFTYLKLRRGTEIDLKDVQAAVKNCPEGFDPKKFNAWASPELQAKLSKVRLKLGL